MGKYEAKVSKTTHLTGLAIAVLISFAVGLGTGYYFGQKAPASSHKEPTKAVSANQAKSAEQTKTDAPENNQEISLKDTLNSFYNVNSDSFNKFKDESLNESTAQGVPQDSLFKNKLIAAYQDILAKGQLNVMIDFINKGSLQSDYFSDYFDSQENTTISSVDNIQAKGNTLSAKVVVTNPFTYGDKYDIPSSQIFFGELKGTGMTDKQYARLLGLKPSKIDTSETKTITVTIEKINGKWMITSMEDALDSSEIKDVTIRNRNVAFEDLMKKYIK